MNKQQFARRTQKLSGPEGIVAAVVAQATRDALYGEEHDKRDALRYLRSDTYRSHLTALGLPDTWIPSPEE